jgi:uncharacterized phage infection (PIP) family protein YhgE
MEYAYSENQKFQGGAALGGIAGAMDAAKSAPRTLNSAAGRLDTLNDRLSKAVEGLAMAASQIGAMTPVSGLNQSKNGQTSASGAVHRLNDSVDEAHAKLSEIENYIQSIGRALG